MGERLDVAEQGIVVVLKRQPHGVGIVVSEEARAEHGE